MTNRDRIQLVRFGSQPPPLCKLVGLSRVQQTHLIALLLQKVKQRVPVARGSFHADQDLRSRHAQACELVLQAVEACSRIGKQTGFVDQVLVWLEHTSATVLTADINANDIRK